jgi:hypothetical protein
MNYALDNDFEIEHVDINSAFLSSDLKEEVYIRLPKECKIIWNEKNYAGKVVKLNKAIYGLKQSAKCLNDNIAKFLFDNKFIQSDADPCLYYLFNDNNEVVGVIPYYVDDF